MVGNSGDITLFKPKGKEENQMNKTILIAMIGLLTILLVGQAVAGSITITRSGASVDEFVDGDKHSLNDSIYDHGILLGDGTGKATPVYRILLPPPTSGGNQITSITVTIEGSNAWLSQPYVYIGTPAQVSESIGDGEYVYFFTGSDARNLLDAVGDGLGYTLDVKLDVGGLTDKYDLKEIKVTYEYSGVSSDILERFAQAYSSYRTLKEYESGMVYSLWNTGEWSAKECFYPAVQECLALADNLSGLSGSPYDSLKSTINCIENFQNLAGILESTFDYTFFWISYSGPSENTVSSRLNDARDSFQTYAQNLLNYAFDGDISSSDTTQLNSDIDIAKTKTTDLRQTMWDVGRKSWYVYISHDNGDGKSTAQIMLYSLAPLLNITYDENSISSEPSYLTGLINELSHFSTVFPPVTFNDANLKALIEENLGIVNPTQSDMLGLAHLFGDSRGIIDLTGLEYATNLASLVLLDNEIVDISALSGLTSLTKLTLYKNHISDLSPLSGLTNLTEFMGQ
ncbi:MAG: hypothetical protein SRB1_00505 [Desulfobacteraceae bacterium Eth-SRB1]|nr:MAG: hypothetical protein SRB1_00505 [Desulfobacteraceae bacterium Eth-SRB1]